MYTPVSFLSLFLVLSSAGLRAEPAHQHTLETLVERALSRSDQISSQKARIAEKSEATTQSGTWANPTLELGAGVKFASPDVGPLFQVGLSQLLYFPGKQELRKQVSGFDKMLEEIKLEDAELGITVDVVRLAYAYALGSRKAKFAETRRKRFELIQGYLAGHTFASPQQKTTSIIVKQRLKFIEADEVQLRGALQATLEQLNFYIDDDSQTISEIKVPWLNGKRLADEPSWIEHALRSNIELQTQRLLVSQATKDKALLSKEAWPDLTVSAFYGQETAGQTERVLGVGVGFPLPIWNLNHAGSRGKEHRVRAEELQLSLKERKLKSLVKKLIAEYVTGQKLVRAYSEESLAALESQLQLIQREFRKNRVDFLLFLELDIEAAETADRVFNAQLSLIDTIASLHFLARDKNLISQLSTF